jgi:gliding motility-associated-like protein
MLNFLGLLNMGSIVNACDGAAATLDAGSVNGATYLWSTGDTTHAITVGDPGPYWVTVSAPGCSSTDTVNVEGGIGAGALYMPNAFTPNGNGLNEVFTGVGSDITSFHLEIWNRWGQKIYVTDDINNGWDGKYKGETVQNDVYVYVVKYTTSCAGLRSLQRIGHVWVGL